MQTNWSNYQVNVFKAIEENAHNVCVNAVAGSGKTTTIVEGAKRLHASNPNAKILFLAFNKSIANELSERIGNIATCSTLHAHGFSLLRKAYGNLKLDTYKWLNWLDENLLVISNSLTPDSESKELSRFKYACRDLFDLCRINLVESNDNDTIESIANHHNITCLGDEQEVVAKMLSNAYDISKGIIDYVDMLVLPIKKCASLFASNAYDYVFIDECQDLSKAQRELMLASVKKGGHFCAVGDPKQAINGFAGASCDSFSLLASIDNTIELPLSVNYRCGYKILELAKEIVPNIEPHDGAISGSVSYTRTFDDLQSGDMIVCRKSAICVRLALKMIANGISAKVKGVDISKSLLSLVEKQRTNDMTKLITKINKELETQLEKQVAKCGGNVDKAKHSLGYLGFEEKVNCILALCDYCSSVEELKNALENLFSDYKDNNSVMLSTIHKSKGLESDRVWIILPDKLPLKWKDQQDWELEQEYNLKYVAITRAKKELIINTLDEDSLATYEFPKGKKIDITKPKVKAKATSYKRYKRY